jgi:hypothetical protein
MANVGSVSTILSPEDIYESKKDISWWVLTIFNLYGKEEKLRKIRSISEILCRKHINERYYINLLFKYLEKNRDNALFIEKFLIFLYWIKGGNLMNNIIEGLNEDKITCYGIGLLANYTSFIQEKMSGKKYGEGNFRKKFNNLKMNKERLKLIYVESIEKLNQYERTIPKYIKELIKKDIDQINLTNTEMSFYFALGYSLGRGGEDNE